MERKKVILKKEKILNYGKEESKTQEWENIKLRKGRK
jgi:hypothetical protein